jgi:hypothetical protein
MTLTEIRNQAAKGLGQEAYADLLTQDQVDVDGLIHEAYLECYSPVAPHNTRGEWTVRYHSDLLKTPVTVTLGLTNGSKDMTVTGVTMEAKYIGSFIKIQDRWYRYAGAVSGTEKLLQPWDGDTGNYPATVYYNAVALPAACAKVIERPSILGMGELWPMPGPEAEIMIRSEPAYDFSSYRNRLSPAVRRSQFSRVLSQDTGDPVFYHVDSGSLTETFAPTKRFHVFPVPDRQCTLEMRMHILPARMTGGSDVPALPGDTATVDIAQTILLPLVRERVALLDNGRRFTGDLKATMRAAELAREQLSKLTKPQRDGGEHIRLARGW